MPLTCLTSAGLLHSTRQERRSEGGGENNRKIRGKKPPKMSSLCIPTGSALEMHNPPAAPSFQDFGDMTGNSPCLSCAHLWGKVLLTRAGLIEVLQPRSLQDSDGTSALSQQKQKEPPGEDPVLQLSETGLNPGLCPSASPVCPTHLKDTNIISLLFSSPPPCSPPSHNKGESPNPSSFLPKTRAPAEQLMPTSRAEPSTTNGLKSPHCTETSLQKQLYFTQTLLNCPGLLLRFLSHH